MDKETLVMLANKLMFTMDDSEYDTLLEEFDTILKQMDLIGKIDGIENVEPMVYPFELGDVCLREDEVVDELEGKLLDLMKTDGEAQEEPLVSDEDFSEIMDMIIDEDGVVIE